MKNLERIVVLVFLIYPVRFFVSATVDKDRLVSAFNQERVWVSVGNFDSYVAYAFYVVIFLILFTHYLRGATSMKFSLFDNGVFASFVFGIIYNFNQWPLTEVIGIIFFFFIFVAIRNQQLTFALINRLVVCQVLILSFILLFPIFNYSRSFSPCTADKCSFLGNLFTSFFPHENALALFLFVGSIFFLARKGIFGYSFFALHGILILMSGSKLVISVFFLLFFFAFFKARILYACVWCVVASSAILFFTRLDPDALTGRGLIFSVGRNFFFDNVFFGYGYGALTDASLNSGEISYRVSHEHNGIAALLIRHGIFGALGITFYLIKVGSDLNQKLRVQIFLLLGLVLTFPTEANSDFSVQNYLAWVYLFVVAKISTRGSEIAQKSLQK
jgi:hypothetical protein